MASVRPAAGTPRRASIRAHLVWLVLAAALPLAALQAWDLYGHMRDDAERARAQVLALAEITASETARLLGQAQNILKGLAARPAVRALDPSRCDPILKDFLGLAPRFANVVTANTDGFVVCSAVPLPGAAPRVASPAQMLRMRTAGTLVVGEPFKSPITGRWVLALAAPLHDAQGRIAGGVALALDLASLPVLPRVSNMSANTVTGLLTMQGTVIARSTDAANFVGTNQAHRADTQALIAMRKGTDEGVGLDGLMRVRGITPVPGTDLIAYATVPASEVYAGAKARIATHALVTLGILLLALLLAVRESRAISEPITAVADAAGEVSRGNLATRAPVAGAAEVAAVTEQFNAMLDSLASAQREY